MLLVCIFFYGSNFSPITKQKKASCWKSKFLILRIFYWHRYTGRGLFLDPPTVFLCNNNWILSLPEWLHAKSANFQDASKWTFLWTLYAPTSAWLFYCTFLSRFLLFIAFDWKFTAFDSRDKIFEKTRRDKSDLASFYSSYISQIFSQDQECNEFNPIGALIMEPGK